MKRKYLFLLALLSGLLLSISWPSRGMPLFLFIAFIPLLLVEDDLCRRKGMFHTFHALVFSYPAFFTWNLLTTWWIYNSTAFGMIMAVLFNSLFMSLVFLAYHWTKKRFFGEGKGYWILMIYWITFECLHQDWDLTWSWLNLGSGFASYPSWVQWYEYTGIFGGTFWVFLGNVAGYQVVRNFLHRKNQRTLSLSLAGWAAIVLVPLFLSLWMYSRYVEKKDPLNVVVVQPNIDPYLEQYSLEPSVIVDRMLTLAVHSVDSTTDFLVFPESAIQEPIWENDSMMALSTSLQTIWDFMARYPRMQVIVGASTFKRFGENEPLTETARFSRLQQFHFDAYNTSILTDVSRHIQVYHKSKLVVGVERMPFPKYLKFLENYAIDLGGTIGSLGISPERTVFLEKDGKYRVATAICYEGVYGEFFSGFVKNGAEVMFIITNDGWWGNTPGHRQHLGFASLRAIETRRCIARSANTGISCFVNQRGDLLQQTQYWEPAVIKASINRNNDLTFYTRYGDLIGTACAWLSLLFLLSTLVKRLFPGFLRKTTS